MPDEESRPVKGMSCVVRSVGSTFTRGPREEDHPARRVAGLRVTGRARSPLPGYSPGTVLGRATGIIPAHRPPVSRLRPIRCDRAPIGASCFARRTCRISRRGASSRINGAYTKSYLSYRRYRDLSAQPLTCYTRRGPRGPRVPGSRTAGVRGRGRGAAAGRRARGVPLQLERFPPRRPGRRERDWRLESYKRVARSLSLKATFNEIQSDRQEASNARRALERRSYLPSSAIHTPDLPPVLLSNRMSVMRIPLCAALHMSYTVSAATLAAVSASISTPVGAVQVALA